MSLVQPIVTAMLVAVLLSPTVLLQLLPSSRCWKRPRGEVVTTFHGGTRPPRDGEHVRVQCWCQRSDVWVPIEEIRAGRTAPCFRKECKKEQIQ